MRLFTNTSMRPLARGLALASLTALSSIALAQTKVPIIYSDVVSENDPRTGAFKDFFVEG